MRRFAAFTGIYILAALLITLATFRAYTPLND